MRGVRIVEQYLKKNIKDGILMSKLVFAGYLISMFGLRMPAPKYAPIYKTNCEYNVIFYTVLVSRYYWLEIVSPLIFLSMIPSVAAK